MESTRSYLNDLQLSLQGIFQEDPSVILLGEDVLDPYGGAFKVTKGLSTRFPDRVIGTPICEATLAGVGTGLALRGFRPVVEIMFGDFITLCADQIINHATKLSAMYGVPHMPVPLVIRTPMGGGRGYGPTHSQNLEKIFLGVPHLNIVAPSLYHSPGIELRKAIYSSIPTLFIEHKLLYPMKLRLPDSPGFPVRLHEERAGEFAVAVLRNYDPARLSPDVLFLAYGGVSRFFDDVLSRAADEEIWVEAAFPAALHEGFPNMLGPLVEKCGRVVIVEDAPPGFGWASELAATIYRHYFRHLHSPIGIVSADSDIIPANYAQEMKTIVNIDKIMAALWAVLK